MSQRNEVVDIILEELERYGLQGQVGDRGKHLEIAWETSNGRRFVIAARTPSDWRAGLNARSEVRKLLRADNLQVKSSYQVSFQKAMSLPKPVIVNREQSIQKDVDALVELVFDLQAQIAALQDVNSSILRKINSATVVSKIEFGKTIDTEPQEEEDFGTEQKFISRPKENLPFREGSKQASVFACLTTQFKSLSEIRKLSGVPEKYVSNTLSKAKRLGFVELGLRGMYRRKA